nr:ribonuclease H-like domain-containing protein [Tanacetum cinerariifolium]
MIKVLPPKIAEEVVTRERERKARTTLLMAFLEDHLAKFHLMADAKEMWEAIKSRFSGNDESKKIHLEIHGARVSNKNANQKFLRSLPSFWSQVALIMRTKPGLDTLSFDDLYNNLRVFERDVNGTIASSTTKQNMAFVFGESTSSTNNVSIAYSVSSLSVSKSQQEGSSSYTNEVIHSFFVNQSSAPQLDYDDLKKINDDDMEEIDIKWQVAIISMRIKKFYKKTGRKIDFIAKGNQDSRRRDVGYNGNKARDNSRRLAYQEDLNALVIVNGEDIDWSGHVEEDAKSYAMMAYSNSGSDNEVQSCSQACADSYARLKKLYDEQRDKLGDASVEITAYTLALKKESNLEDTPVNDGYADGIHAVPPPMTGNCMPSGPDVDINYSKFTYGPKQTLADESNSKPSEYTSCESDSSVKPSLSVPEPVENES